MRTMKQIWVAMAWLFVVSCTQTQDNGFTPPPPPPTPIQDVATPAGLPTTSPAPPEPTATLSTAYLPQVLGENDPADPVSTIPVSVTTQPLPGRDYPVYDGPVIDRRDLGIQIHLHREDLEEIMRHLRALDVGWVKVQVSWKVYEPEPGRLDEARFRELDQLVSRSAGSNIRVLLSVAKAPEWSRPVTEMDGPPADYNDFTNFMRTLAGRYQGNVFAYELWNEPNLQREWNGGPLSAADTVELLRFGAAGVRAADPFALVISAAPATTGINDGVTAIDDRVFFQGMIDAGVGDVMDGIGVHPYGWANPPESSVAAPDPSVPTHNNHRSFFFQDTLDDYRTMLDTAGYGDKELWVTEFGWGSFEEFGAAPPAGADFMAQVSEWEQAEYTLAAIEMGAIRPGIGPLFLWNLNFAPLLGPDFTESGYSVLGVEGMARPVYLALQTIPRQ